MESITFLLDESGLEAEFYVLEQTKIGGNTYILVTDSDEAEAECLILRESTSSNEEMIYDIVEDEAELHALMKVFMEILEDVSIES